MGFEPEESWASGGPCPSPGMTGDKATRPLVESAAGYVPGLSWALSGKACDEGL